MRGARLSLWVPWGVLLLGLVAELASILRLTQGKFTYSLDDPYIHLALAENIARGHYGVNTSEASAPSSSIAWPLLLAPTALCPWGDWVPLVFNTLCALLTLWLCRSTLVIALARAGATPEAPEADARVALLLCALILGANLIGLVFTGMEHSLQVLAAMALLYGVVTWDDEAPAPWWWVLSVVAGPLVRYENLVLSVPAVAFVALRGRPRLAAGLAGATVAPLVAFSLFLWSRGLGLMPSSIVAKSHETAPVGIFSAFATNLNTPAASLLLLGAALMMLRAWRVRGAERPLRVGVALAVCGHLGGGHFGWLARYEIYIWLCFLVAALYIEREWWVAPLIRAPLWKLGAAAAFFVLVPGFDYWAATVRTPLACSNIYEQQRQMHRFVQALYPRPVAVLDLGWVAWRNEQYVLDLWGLASRQALQARRSSPDSRWMNRLASEHSVRLAMVATELLPPLPPSWILLGRLHLAHTQVSTQSDSVAFYALDEATARSTRPALRTFQGTLPPGVDFRFAPRPRDAASRQEQGNSPDAST